MGALDGIRVLDLARSYPASIAAMYLGDFGAEVIKIDSPVQHANQSARYVAFSPRERNKRSMILDLKVAAHREVFYRLVRTADALIENNRPGVMAHLKCDFDTLKHINPRLVYCACSGFGQDGPYTHIPGHDMNYIALNGALSLVGPKNGPPCFPSNMIADIAGCALHATIGTLIALLYQQKTGKGQFVDISYMDGAMATMASELTHYFCAGTVPRRGMTRFTGGKTPAEVAKIDYPLKSWGDIIRNVKPHMEVLTTPENVSLFSEQKPLVRPITHRHYDLARKAKLRKLRRAQNATRHQK